MTIVFDRKIQLKDIPLFRGAVVSSMDKAPVQFHNHGESGLIYSYPLVQYKIIDGYAAVVCIGESIGSIGSFLSGYQPVLRIGSTDIEFPIKDIRYIDATIRHSDSMLEYHLSSWLPFNQANYNRFKSIDSLSEKCTMMEKILTGNILSFSKGLGFFLNFNVQCIIQQMSQSGIREFKNVGMMAYDIRFKSNIILPGHIGLGKGVSHGFGVLEQK